ncbi:Thiosulfate sulfurtransferase [Thermaerobacter marianensis DSM 12885]|uniref:Sulfurtransferase n=1 Tax=Thermaerobacter marianensis (strain ATCC 700841 / DSM 12885 / JCM 10246 / 7p75a) TaxID=644966 RepID=E6SJF3_THEM7|nr:sulfurtransferase [Thermaerobacter marianensis]ADU52108.1 Thiosulfate sulfurtransferase [Thermaerobacter marianensis DSM 12885]
MSEAAEKVFQERGYAHPEVLVSTEWVAEHLDELADPNSTKYRLVESDEDVTLYEVGHIPGAVKIDWHTDLQDPVVRDYLSPEQFAKLMSEKGIDNDTTVIFYGDKNNWWAAYAFWVFQLFGHKNLKIMDGGRAKWEAEGRPLTKEVPTFPKTHYKAVTRYDPYIRAFKEDVLRHIEFGKPLIDVRSPDEYSGKLLHMENYPQEGAQRGGHIKGAKNVPWAKAVNPDGTFKSADQLRKIYLEEQGLKPDDDVIVYCRIGERSSHTWFALKYLLGFDSVRNYDGSWTEWGNLVRAPIER